MTLLDPQPPPAPPHPMASAPMSRDESDYDSSCSSSAAGGRGSRRSWISDVSFSSSSSVSLRSFGSDTAGFRRAVDYYKPHKANQAEWEAIRRVQAVDGRVCLDHFRLVRRLGSGDIGNVYLCRLREPGPYWSSASGGGGGCAYAMKVVDREALAVRKKLQRAEAEREILAMLDHPFLPTLYASFEAAHYSCFVMEFCPGGDLHALRQRQPGRRFSVSSAKFYVAEILLALEYLHMMGIVYRDLKPENVLVRADGHIMLSDFDLSFKCDVVPRLLRHQAAKRLPSGKHPPLCVPPPMQPVLSCLYGGERGCARKARDEDDQAPPAGDAGAPPEPELVAEPVAARSRSFVGTHEYLAPEVISGAGHGSAVDWWTLGVFLYELLFGQTPFKGDNNEKTLINILKQPLRFPRMAANGKDWEDMARAQDLICRLLVKNPKRRVGSSKGSTEIKRHEFFKGVNWALIRSVRPPEVPRDLHRAKAKAAPTSSVAAAAPSKKKETTADFYHNNIVLQHFDYF